MKADVQATAARKFGDPGSYVTPDGREILKGIDWTRRVKELSVRAQGRCEYVFKTAEGEELRCARPAQDPHHIVLRSRKRCDKLESLLGVCRHHHQMLDILQRRERHKR